MLVEPHMRGRNRATGSPIVFFHLGSLRPHEGVTLAFENQDIGPWTMAVRFLVGPHRGASDMGRNDIIAELQFDIGRSGTFAGPVVKLQLLDIGNEARVPDPLIRNRHSLPAKVVFLATIA